MDDRMRHVDCTLDGKARQGSMAKGRKFLWRVSNRSAWIGLDGDESDMMGLEERRNSSYID